jgi:2-dehydropantoate 2-reductase
VPDHVCIVGCGAIGGLFAAHLAQLEELEVWAFDLDAEHVRAIDRDGLRLRGRVELVAAVNARTDPTQIPACRFGIVATKGTVTEPAIVATAGSFADGAVCSVQNGIGNEELIAAHVPRVIRGVTLPASRVVAPGVIESDGHGQTWIGPFEPSPAPMVEVRQLAELLTRSGIETLALDDARGAQWTKLLFNAATNPLCALTGLTHGQLIEHEPLRRLSAELIREGEEVARALGITLQEDPLELVLRLGEANYDHRPSMLQDVAARRPTEIAMLNGGIVAAGRGCGVATPLNDAVSGLVAGLERGWRLQ